MQPRLQLSSESSRWSYGKITSTGSTPTSGFDSDFTLLPGCIYRIKHNCQSTRAVYLFPLFQGTGTAPPSVSDAVANHPCIFGAGRCPKPDTKCCKICQGITSLRCGCTLALLPASICCRYAARRLAPFYPL